MEDQIVGNIQFGNNRIGTVQNRKSRFGDNWENVIKRDFGMCVKCGMTNEEHILKWNRSITVHHKDGKGCNSKIKNNSLDNLEVLCLSCHAKEHYSTSNAYKNKCKTRCENGHKFTEKNTWIRNNGWRVCRICRKNYAKKHFEKRRTHGV